MLLSELCSLRAGAVACDVAMPPWQKRRSAGLRLVAEPAGSGETTEPRPMATR